LPVFIRVHPQQAGQGVIARPVFKPWSDLQREVVKEGSQLSPSFGPSEMAVAPDPINWYFHQFPRRSASGPLPQDKNDQPPKPNTMKKLKIFALSTVLAAACATSNSAVAQEQAEVSYIAQTTSQFVMPEGTTRAEVQKTFQEYYDKVIAKSTLVKHYSMYIHAWGSLGASYVTTMEFEKWEDLGKFNEEFEELAKAAWPDETARKAFFKKLGSYSDPHHSDEIFTVMNSMRK
jgi:hypothetical protein